MAGTDGTDVATASRHGTIATEMLDGRSAAGSPAVSPDGGSIAFVVATIELDANRTVSRVWLAGPDGDPAPITAGPRDGSPWEYPRHGRFPPPTSSSSP